MSSTVLNRSIALAAFALAASGLNLAFASGPETGASVVARLYKDFAWQAIGGQPELFGEVLSYQSKSVLVRYFDPVVTSLLLQDANCQVKSAGICHLDFDPIFASQDPSVADLEIGEASAGVIPVTFKNPANDQKTKLDFKVVMISGKWKIADIVYGNMDGVSLKQILTRPR
jgi:hypothetical protein